MASDPKTDFGFTGKNVEAQRWARKNAASLIKVNDETKKAVRKLVVRSIKEGIPVLEAAKDIQKMVGMTRPQIEAAVNYRSRLRMNTNLSKKKIQQATDRYAKKKIRERARMIARTEVVNSLTAGQQASMNQAQRSKFLGPDARKRWVTSYGACVICAPLGNTTRRVKEDWRIGGSDYMHPTAHPNCRCTIMPIPGKGIALTPSERNALLEAGLTPPPLGLGGTAQKEYTALRVAEAKEVKKVRKEWVKEREALAREAKQTRMEVEKRFPFKESVSDPRGSSKWANTGLDVNERLAHARRQDIAMREYRKDQRRLQEKLNTLRFYEEKQKKAQDMIDAQYNKIVAKIKKKHAVKMEKEPVRLLVQTDAGPLVETRDLHTIGTKKNGERIYSAERTKLHDEIVEEFLKDVDPVKNPEVVVLGGGPASGKTLAEQASKKRFITTRRPKGNVASVDVDKVRQKFPEYQDIVDQTSDVIVKRAAAITHEEASDLAKRIIEEGQKRKLNIIIDGTGDNSYKKLAKKVQQYKDRGATKVTAHYVSIDTEEAVIRSFQRYRKSKRYVPEKVLRETHANVSRIIPEAIDTGLFDEISVWDNNVWGTPAQMVARSADGTRKQLKVVNKSKWQRMLAKGDEGRERSLREIEGGWPIGDDIVRTEGKKYADEVKKYYDPYLEQTMGHTGTASARALKGETRGAVENYTGQGYEDINKALRTNPNQKLEDMPEYDVDKIQKAIKSKHNPKPPPPELVFRGVNITESEIRVNMETGKSELVYNPFRTAKDGDIIEQHGFSSTTISPKKAITDFFIKGKDDIVLEIIPTEGLYIESVSVHKHEKEFLIAHKARFRVVGPRKKVKFETYEGETRTVTVQQVEQLPPSGVTLHPRQTTALP